MKKYLILSFLIHLVFPQSIDFTDTHVKTNYYGYFIPEKKINELFNERTIHKQVTVSIRVPPSLLKELFSDLELAVSKANQYANQKFEISQTKNRYSKTNVSYFAHDGMNTTAYIYPLAYSKDEDNFKYYCRSKYKGKVYLRGSFLMDVKILDQSKKNAPLSVIVIHSYFQLDNGFLSEFAHSLRSFKKFNAWLNRVILNTIRYIVRVGKKTMYAYENEKKLNTSTLK